MKGEKKATAKVSHFKGNDPSKWRSNISTYNLVSLGEIYKGIELKLKAYGNNVEKLFYVKPGANPGDIRIKIEGAKEDNPPKSPFKKLTITHISSSLAGD